MDAIIVNRESVKGALYEWCVSARKGETLSLQETAALSAAEIAEQSSDYLLLLLAQHGEALSKQISLPLESLAEGETMTLGQLTEKYGADTLVSKAREVEPAVPDASDFF